MLALRLALRNSEMEQRVLLQPPRTRLRSPERPLCATPGTVAAVIIFSTEIRVAGDRKPNLNKLNKGNSGLHK